MALDEIRIRGLGVIADAEFSLDPGLTVLTGETGAGKTMVIAALALLFGGRSDAGALTGGEERAIVEGRLDLRAHPEALALAEECGAELEEGCLLISRSVGADGRSRGHLGGRAVPAGILADLGALLLTVHGQSDQTRLLRPAEQRAALDRYAGTSVATALAAYRDEFLALRQLDAEMADLAAHAAERGAEAERLRAGLARVTAASPEPGEDERLTDALGRLEHAEALRSAASAVHTALSGPAEDSSRSVDNTDVTELLGIARREATAAAGYDVKLDALTTRLDELAFLTADLGLDFASYLSALEADPQRLADAQQRKATLEGLTRDFAPTIDGVLAWAATAAVRLAELEDDGRLATLSAARVEVLERLGAKAAELRRTRQSAAVTFGAAVSEELTGLAMPQAKVEAVVGFRATDPGLVVEGESMAFGPQGVDEVELRLLPHPGAVARPLQKGASGGELSRVMLAVEVVFAAADPVGTMIFDEVDAGVGGAAAVEVGRRLARLARTHQVVCVTHLPQVAAFANRHLVVVKSSEGTVTTSGVAAVEGEERARELSRMLAGLDDSDLARGHARELLDLAESERSEARQ